MPRLQEIRAVLDYQRERTGDPQRIQNLAGTLATLDTTKWSHCQACATLTWNRARRSGRLARTREDDSRSYTS